MARKRRIIEKGSEAHIGAENFIRSAKGGKIPMSKKGGSPSRLTSTDEAELSAGGLKIQRAQFRERNSRAGKDCKTPT